MGTIFKYIYLVVNAIADHCRSDRIKEFAIKVTDWYLAGPGKMYTRRMFKIVKIEKDHAIIRFLNNDRDYTFKSNLFWLLKDKLEFDDGKGLYMALVEFDKTNPLLIKNMIDLVHLVED